MSNIAKRPPFSALIATPAYQRTISNTLKDPAQAKRFCAAITSAVATNPALQECDPPTILSGALLGESLNLSPSPQLGQYYLVPFDNKKKGCKDAQFILGYKGLVQLALRSGYYKKLNVLSVKEGELVSWDPLDEICELNLIADEEQREETPTIGYVAFFEYQNGFRKTIYWSKSKMERHADKYSKAFSLHGTGGKHPKVSYHDYLAGNYPKEDSWKYSSFWYADFDGMAYKTMLRHLISKWGVMSTELQTAIEAEVVAESDDYTDDTVPAEVAQPAEPPAEAPKELTLDDI